MHRSSSVERAGGFLHGRDGDGYWYGYGHLHAWERFGDDRDLNGHAYLGSRDAQRCGHGAARDRHDLEAGDHPG